MDFLRPTKPPQCLPRRFAGKNGTPFRLEWLPATHRQRLLDMYLAFQPRNCFQGLPPIKDAVCVQWVDDMLHNGINMLALAEPSKTIVGHTAMFPINPRKCEMLVVVCPEWQNMGIGTELVQCCIDVAAELGFERIWLPVDAANVRARHVYRKCGFEYVSNPLGREMDMACQVHEHAKKPAAMPPTPHFPTAGLTQPDASSPTIPCV